MKYPQQVWQLREELTCIVFGLLCTGLHVGGREVAGDMVSVIWTLVKQAAVGGSQAN